MSSPPLIVEEALKTAIRYHQAQQWPEAEQLYRAVLAQVPQHPDAHHNLGVMALQLGKPEVALPHLTAALQANPSHAQFWLSLATALIDSGRLTDAARLLDQAAPRGLAGPAVEALKARITRGQAAEAAASSLQSLVAGGPLPMPEPPKNRQQRRAGRAGATSGSNRGNKLYAQAMAKHRAGVLAFEAGQNESAADFIESAIKLNAGVATFHANLALVRFAQGQTEAGLASCRRALDIDPSLTDAHYNMGNAYSRLGRHDAAIAAYRRALQLNEGFADAHNNLGIALQSTGQFSEAITHFERAHQLQPDYPGILHNIASAATNHGNTLLEQGRPDEAVAQYQRALSVVPAFAEAFYNLGNARQAQGRLPEAIDSFRQAVALKPDDARALNNLGTALRSEGHLDEAAQVLRAAIAHDPGLASAAINLGSVLYLLTSKGEAETAIRLAHEWVNAHPDDATARHTLASLQTTGGGGPERASDGYVQSLFDSFASDFDAQLTKIQYQGPALVTRKVAQRIQRAGLDVLDAGCGTGMAGVPMRARARSLTGVDLSRGMLAEARKRNIYDELHQSELVAFMHERPAAYDLVVAADVLNYFGDLGPVCASASRALRPQGHLVFTVEASAAPLEAGWRLMPHGRFCHDPAYLERTLAATGFGGMEIEPCVIRREGGRDVGGFVVTTSRA